MCHDQPWSWQAYHCWPWFSKINHDLGKRSVSSIAGLPTEPDFLVGAFSLKEKSPTITVNFFSADNLTLNGPLFLQFLQSYIFSVSQFLTILSLRSSIFISFKKLNGAKEYFRLCETFFRKKLFFSPKGPTFKFLIFLDRMDFEKSQMVPPFIKRVKKLKISIKGSPIHQYFDILKSFWYFWALDMAPTWAETGLFKKAENIPVLSERLVWNVELHCCQMCILLFCRVRYAGQSQKSQLSSVPLLA